jgi:hypothetical protein
MNRLDMINRVRSMTRDFTSSIFREQDITDFINEAVDRCGQIIPALKDMGYLQSNDAVPPILPPAYHNLLAIYSTSRCFGQDERHYQATTYMNEFETKMEELRLAVENGRVTLKDTSGNTIDTSLDHDFVSDDYFFKRHTGYDDGINDPKFDFPDDPDF